MYTIYAGGNLLHSDVPDYQLANARLVMEANQPGSLEFTIAPDHPAIFALEKLKAEVVLKKSGTTYWKGRIVDDTQALDTTRRVYCEGKLKCLGDTVIRPHVYDGTAATVFAAYLNEHNRQVADYQKILPGTVTVTGDIYRALINYESTYDRVQDLVKSLGGYLVLRYESDGDYLDWKPSIATTAAQSITLGENLISLSQELSAEKLYTVCIPRGAKLADENGATTETRLGVESLKGVDYIFDSDLVQQYGWICAPVSETTWDDITTASALLTKGQAYLNANKGLILTLAITAVDLKLAGQNINSFNFLENINVVSTVHGIQSSYLLTKLELDITNPAGTRIVLGSSVMTLTDKNKQAQQDIVLTMNDLATALTGTAVDLAGEIAAREAYIRYDGGTIEMGETGSNLKMRLTNTKLSFWETIGGVETEVAYIANPTGNPGDSKLYIENAKVLNELIFGGFAFQVRDNGNVSLVWKG